MERPSLRRLFSVCDVNKSGKIEYEDFTVVCRELSVPETEIGTLFDKFDPHEDGYIDYNRFSSRFQEVSETLDLASFGAGASQYIPMSHNFCIVTDVIFLSGRGQLADLYKAIHSSANMTLLQQYEELIHSLISQSLDKQLSSSLQGLSWPALLTASVSQERKKMEEIMAGLQRRHENEVADLHASVERLLKSKEDSERNHSKEEMLRLSGQIGNLSHENEQLRGSLLQAQTNIAILHSELDKLKNVYADQKAQHERETEDLKRMAMEYQSYSSQIQILQELNKKLYDSNDDLRSVLASEAVAAKRRLSPQNEIPARRMKPLRQSTLNHSGKLTYSHVATWADKYLDSGVSLPMDTAESSGSDYDSDDSRSSVETVHFSYSCVPSDMEISEVKSEAAVSMAPSMATSIASSLRRRLSAFSPKQPLEADMEACDEPTQMYRLVLAGDAGAGKSSFLLRLTLNEFRDDIQTTLGVDFQMKRMLVDGEKTNLQIWDTAGQERFRSIARSYFRKAHGVLLLYDVTSESSFLNVRAWVDQIQESAEEKIPMCVIGNKVDLRGELPEGSCVSSLHGMSVLCFAKEGTNITEAVLHLAREVKKNVKLRPQSDSQVRLNQISPKKTLNNCCGL
uniref:Ras and EF-hand domain-containing protein-like n=1 Tax=Pundamilia nyererei TaxID=303518 RepID=A0A3B4FWG3_9CICH